MSLDAETRDRISALVRSNSVFLFMKGNPEAPQCGFSAQGRKLAPDDALEGHVNLHTHASRRLGCRRKPERKPRCPWSSPRVGVLGRGRVGCLELRDSRPWAISGLCDRGPRERSVSDESESSWSTCE